MSGGCRSSDTVVRRSRPREPGWPRARSQPSPEPFIIPQSQPTHPATRIGAAPGNPPYEHRRVSPRPASVPRRSESWPAPPSRKCLPSSLGSDARGLHSKDGPGSAEGRCSRGNSSRKYRLRHNVRVRPVGRRTAEAWHLTKLAPHHRAQFHSFLSDCHLHPCCSRPHLTGTIGRHP